MLRFEGEFLDYLRLSHAGILSSIRESTKFEEDTELALAAAYDSFLDQFETSDGHSVKPAAAEPVDPTTDAELGQEQIVKQKRA